MSNGKRPDWTLCIKTPEGKWEKVGAAWNTERGNICVRLEANMPAGNFMAFPYREESRGWKRPASGGYRPPRPLPPVQDAAQIVSKDYRARLPVDPPGSTPANQDDDCPDPEAPDWL